MKRLLKIGISALLGMVILMFVLSFSLNSTIRSQVETMGSDMTGTSVTLEHVDFSLFSGQSQLRQLIIGNPEGFISDHALKLEVVQSTMDLASVFSDILVFEEIVVERPQIILEGNFTSNNIERIREHVNDYFSIDKNGQPEKQNLSFIPEKFRIHKLSLSNAKVTFMLSFLQDDSLTVPLPDIYFEGLGMKPGGATSEEVTAEIMEKLELSIFKSLKKVEGVERGIENVEESLIHIEAETKEAVSEIFKKLKDVFRQDN